MISGSITKQKKYVYVCTDTSLPHIFIYVSVYIEGRVVVEKFLL